MPSSVDKGAHRPTLPPIRDLFRDELSQHPNYGQESPQAILARLRVHDDGDDSPSHYSAESSARRYSGPASSSNFRPRASSSAHGYRYDPPPHSSSELDYPYSSPRTNYAFEPSYRAEYEQPSLQRSLSHQHIPPYSRDGEYGENRTYTRVPAHYDSSHGPYSHDPRHSHIPAHPSSRVQTVGVLRPSPWPIATGIDRGYDPNDDERTPIARYASATHAAVPPFVDEPPAAKYECQYCGKGFNRPSSLKIHLNSHTGEKPFVCPVEGCGRSFSVLSNMRRHARVHTTPSGKEKDGSSDVSDGLGMGQGTELPPPGSFGPKQGNDAKWHQRRGSIASTSSSASRRSRSESSEDEEDDERPEKRSRQ
ncbi:hypothetical protein D9611_000037 [Ephemerocybe angulata]|uniref:C2H2-type domain-containing protein n=1 Tax=Ephemerocybe angulata TaxID=980116 RepID=A0A8H5BME6_9AGAR|nr:hypothetical protein D9611_000037 [Tulosesus angulatus]